MKKWGMVLWVSSLFLFCKRSEGQVANYVFSAFAGTYTPISGGTEVFELEDDDVFSSSRIPLGFNFVYDGVTYTDAWISSNGHLDFRTNANSVTATQARVNSLTNSNLLNPALYPLWDDLDGFDGFAYYLTTGSPGSRVFTFEWRNYYWDYFAAVPGISFEVKLYEGTNLIQFIYQQEAGAVSVNGATIGIAGTAAGDYLTLNNSTASPTASSSTFTTSITTKPATGQVYQFAAPACTGTPTGGTTASTANPACNGTSFTLSVTGGTSGYTGLTYQWQSSPDGTTWTNIGGATSTTYTTSISTSTYFRRIITCVGSNNSSSLQVIVQKPTTSATPPSVCVNSSSVLTASASAGTTTILSENFNGAAAGWTKINNSTGGSSPSSAAWTLRPDGYMNTGGTIVFTFHSNDNSQFYLTNSDAAGSGVTASTILQSPSFSTVGYSSVSLQFYHHFNYLSGETAKVEVSTNGSSWTTLQTYTSDQGTESAFVSATISLNAYINNATVYIRFKYDAGWDWFWAVDNVTITGTPSATTYAWTASPAAGAGLPAGAGTLSAANSSISVTPTTIGNITYTVSTNNSCLGPASVVVASTTGGPVTSTTCLSRTVITGDNYFVNGTCNLLAKIVPQGGGTAVSGSVNVCSRIESGTTFYNSEPYLMRHFDIEPSSNASTATARVTVYVLQSEFDDYNTNCGWFPKLPINSADVAGYKINLRITQCHGTYSTQPLPGYYSGSPVLIDPADTDIVWNATTSCWEISFDVTGFSGFFIHTTITGYPLSAQFISLTGKREGAVNILKWKVPNEQNIRGYELECSYDGQSFASIGFVNSLAPGGNSAAELQYSFTDNNFTGDKQYYRLKQTAMDGRVKMSSVVLVKGSTPASLTLSGLFPNPASSIVNVMIESPVRNELTILLSDINGRVLQAEKIIAEKGTTIIPINTEQLAGGTYLIKLICPSGCEDAVRKFVKN